MIGAELKIESITPQAVTQPLERGAYKNLGHAAASIRKDAQASIRTAEGPSPAGTPPHTHKRRKGTRGGGGNQLRRSIVFFNDRKAMEAGVGPRHSIVGTSGAAHEFGQVYKQADYPERPYMGPSLNRNTDRFGASFAGSMGG